MPWMSHTVYLLFLHAYVYNIVFMHTIQIYWYACAHLYSPFGFRITTRLGSFIWLPWILTSRSWSLELEDSSCWGPSLLLWSGQISCSSSPILASPCWLAASPVTSWAPFCTVHICTSLCILAFAPIRWCNIIVIFITFGDNFVIVLICWNV